jgi:chemotaxis protein MotB
MSEEQAKTILAQYRGSRMASHAALMRSADHADDDSNWLVSLSDILTLLLVFFIMFLVLTNNSGGFEKPGPEESRYQVIPAVEINEPVTIVGRRVREEMGKLHLGGNVSISSTEKEVIITIRENITFPPGEADILPSFEPVLDNLAAVIHKHDRLQVDIIGHTDNVPIHTYRYPSNWELSVGRAASVLKYLIHRHSMDAARLSIKGNADQVPVAPNDTPENRALNRRVEIRLRHLEA